MKSLKSKVLSILSKFFKIHKPESENHFSSEDMTSNIFEALEVQGVNTSKELLYGYFFVDKKKNRLERLKNKLIELSYNIVELSKRDNGIYILHVEKVEIHSKDSLLKREDELTKLAMQFDVYNYDGFDVGNTVPNKALITEKQFVDYMKSKSNEELFELAIKLYELEIFDKAKLVFYECISKGIKSDICYYKLGYIFINEDNAEKAIEHYLRAIDTNPFYLEAFYNLGATYYQISQYERSIFYYEMADKLKANDSDIIYGIAASQYALSQYENALTNCQRALQLNQGNDNAVVLMKMLKKKMKNNKF